MSYEVTITVTCDACDTYFVDDIEGVDDIEYTVENAGGECGVEINGEYFEHVCENCTNELYYCENCSTHIWSDDTYSCADWTTCSDCVEEVHLIALEDGIIGVEDGVCNECDWEFPAPPKSVIREPLVLL